MCRKMWGADGESTRTAPATGGDLTTGELLLRHPWVSLAAAPHYATVRPILPEREIGEVAGIRYESGDIVRNRRPAYSWDRFCPVSAPSAARMPDRLMPRVPARIVRSALSPSASCGHACAHQMPAPDRLVDGGTSINGRGNGTLCKFICIRGLYAYADTVTEIGERCLPTRTSESLSPMRPCSSNAP
jgi:hypothetical protein